MMGYILEPKELIEKTAPAIAGLQKKKPSLLANLYSGRIPHDEG